MVVPPPSSSSEPTTKEKEAAPAADNVIPDELAQLAEKYDNKNQHQVESTTNNKNNMNPIQEAMQGFVDGMQNIVNSIFGGGGGGGRNTQSPPPQQTKPPISQQTKEEKGPYFDEVEIVAVAEQELAAAAGTTSTTTTEVEANLLHKEVNRRIKEAKRLERERLESKRLLQQQQQAAGADEKAAEPRRLKATTEEAERLEEERRILAAEEAIVLEKEVKRRVKGAKRKEEERMAAAAAKRRLLDDEEEKRLGEADAAKEEEQRARRMENFHRRLLAFRLKLEALVQRKQRARRMERFQRRLLAFRFKLEALVPGRRKKEGEEKAVEDDSIAQQDDDDDDDEEEDAFSNNDLLASIEAAQRSMDEGWIAGIDEATKMEDEKMDWEHAEKLAQALSSSSPDPIVAEQEEDEDDSVDMDAIAAAARQAVEAYEKQNFQPSQQEEIESEPTHDSLSMMTVVQLKEELGRRGLKKSGRKSELIARLKEADGSATVETSEVGEVASNTGGGSEVKMDWSKLRVKDLKEELRRRGLPVSGRKAQLVAALEESDNLSQLVAKLEESDYQSVDRAVESEPETVVETEAPPKSFRQMTVVLLKDQLRRFGLRVSGRKAELVARLEEHTSKNDESATSTVAVDHAAPETASTLDVKANVAKDTAAPVAVKNTESINRQMSEPQQQLDNKMDDMEEIARAAREAVKIFEANESQYEDKMGDTEEMSRATGSADQIFQANESHDTDEMDDMEEVARAARAAVQMFEAQERQDDDEDILFDKNDMEDMDEVARAAREAVKLFEASNSEAAEAVNGDESPELEPLRDWSKLTVAQLREEASSRGIPTSGKKIELIAALEAYDMEEMRGTVTEEGPDSLLDELRLDMDDIDLEALGKAARDAVLMFEAEDEPSDEALWEIENGAEAEDVMITPADMVMVASEQERPPPSPDYEGMAVSQLKAELRNRGLRVTGKKVDLIERLRSSD